MLMASQWKILVVLVILVCAECRRTSGGGGRWGSGSRTGGGSHTGTHYGGSNTHYGGSNTHYGGSNTHSGGSNTHSGGTNTGGGSKPIGFEHYNVQGHTYNTGNTQGGGNRPIGFEGVQDRVPHQNNRPNYNTNYNQPGSHASYNPHGYHGGQNYVPPGYQQHAHGGYYTTNPQPPSGYQNNYLSQPNSYYHPQYQTPHQTPVIYQPQQSSGSNLLGYAGSFAGGLAGGYLISSLTHSAMGSHHEPYVVHHYYNNNNNNEAVPAVPRKTSVYGGNLVKCDENEIKGLCVPNTFPICMYNGTVMCVTHLKYVVPCVGLNTSAACVLTVLPCGNNCNNSSNNTVSSVGTSDNSTVVNSTSVNSANSTAANSTSAGNATIATYIPCLTNTTIITDTKDSFCVTAIAEPKEPRIPSGRVVAAEPNSGSFKSFAPVWLTLLIAYCLNV